MLKSTVLSFSFKNTIQRQRQQKGNLNTAGAKRKGRV